MTRIHVRVTPRSTRDAIEGFDPEGVLRLRVTAAPADGAANAAATKLLARALGLPRRDVALVAGAAARLKVFDVPLDGAAILDRIPRPPA